MWIINRSINKYQVDYWVDFDTLLVIIREKDIIGWDWYGDVDVVVESYKLHEKMTLVKGDLAKKKGYKITKHNWDAYII